LQSCLCVLRQIDKTEEANLMNVLLKALALLAAAVNVSCGGGGGGSTPTTTEGLTNSPIAVTPGTETPKYSAAKYAGFYTGMCAPISRAFNVETSAPLYVSLYQVVQPSTTASAVLKWRADFYDTPTCSGSAVGYLENNNASNKVTVVGQALVNGKTVDRVIVEFGAPDPAPIISRTGTSVVMGSAIKLSVPDWIFSAYGYSDIWYLEGGKFLDGGNAIGLDGFPVTLDTDAVSTQLNAPLPLPPQPCAAKTVTWQFATYTCSSTTVPKPSSSASDVQDLLAPGVGGAVFSCTNGDWGTPTWSFCSGPAPVCSPQTFTWNVDGNTCSAFQGGLRYAGEKINLSTTDPTGNTGGAALVCENSGLFALDPSSSAGPTCVALPPKPPRITDPLLLAESKNCMLCHSQTVESIGPSFKRIADFYRGKVLSPVAIESRIIYGSVGIYGDVPMPANPQVDLWDATVLRDWILSR
jgi:cytochrome c